MEKMQITTHSREALQDITGEIQALMRQKAEIWQEGALVIYSPHTTCGLTVNEGADPDVALDMRGFFNTLVPQSSKFRHAEGNSDAHIKTSIFGPSLTLIVENGQVQLGTWQHIYLCECDGPRQRQLWVQFLRSDR